MSFTIEFEQNGVGAILVWRGVANAEDMIEATRRIYQDDPDRKLRYQIWNFLDCGAIEVSNEQLLHIAQIDRDGLDNYPHHAIVADAERLDSLSQ